MSYGLGQAMLAADISREESQEDKRIREYLERISSNSHQDAIWGMIGTAIGSAALGPLGAFLGKTLFSTVSKQRRGGFDKPPDMGGGKFYRDERLDQIQNLKDKHKLFGTSHMFNIAADAANYFGVAGGAEAIGKEGWGTMTTYGTGPTAKPGFFGTSKQAGGEGIKWGGWEGMQLDPGQYTVTDPSLAAPGATPVTPGGTALPADPNQPLTAGQVYQRPRFNKIFGGQPTQTPAFWGYQTGRLGAANPYQALTPIQQQQNELQQFYNLFKSVQPIINPND